MTIIDYAVFSGDDKAEILISLSSEDGEVTTFRF